jgi:hypothetical protein
MGFGIGCAIAVAMTLALAAGANAAQVYQQQSGHRSNVHYSDRNAEDNSVVAKVIMGGYGVLVTDSTATITTVAPQDTSTGSLPCQLLDAHRALCVNPAPHPEPIGGFSNAYLSMSLGAGDNTYRLDPESLPPEADISTADGDDVISTGRTVFAFVSDFDGTNSIRVGPTQRGSSVTGGRGRDRIDVKNGTGGDHVQCSWLDVIVPEGDRVHADRDDVIDADCG